ncbi:hypothetical protein FBY21_1401 [Pseudomonas sp. SLBN-26]|uniref:hypothetical protein n=1 Tax=Pseudomonadaceae TaxID=135621 RepID=UPI00114D5A01|nr:MULTISPECIES: hypothetical protein [Pseudomonas]MCP1616797.1 hypothetical protein [Pseudomonas otitidis]TQL06049.1 hypothetical protein FBY21_1401 [Pseudomonas sp. SLBN-26]
MHPDYENFYSIAGSLRGFRADQAQFGSFPLPTENTVLAAELLSRIFSELGTPKNLGAICIVELRSDYGITFVINASGGGDLPDAAMERLNTELQEAIGSSYCRISCVTLDTAAIFYSPAHADTKTYIRESFLPSKDTPDLNDVDAAIRDIRELPEAFFGINPGGAVIGGNFNTAAVPIRRILACAVALRCDLFSPAQRSIAKQRIQTFRSLADRHPYPDRGHLATNLEALCIPGGNPNQYLYRDDPNIPISSQNAIQKHVAAAWRCADSSRYCAEPKSFNLIKTRKITGSLAGQLAMWWDNRVNRYSTANLNVGVYADFMLPCSSCCARSAQIIGGITAWARPTTSQDEPLITIPKTATRLRRGSF